MTIDDFSTPVHTDGAWALTFRVWYRLLRIIKVPLVWLTMTRGFGNIVVFSVKGRHSGTERRVPLGLLQVSGRWYLGHPSGDTAWTRNLRAADTAIIESANTPGTRVRGAVLERGSERDAVVRATFRQHPFPGDAIYKLAGKHVSGTGVFFRLEPVPEEDLSGSHKAG